MGLVSYKRQLGLCECLALLTLLVATFECSGQDVDAQANIDATGSSDPCAGLVEPSVMSLLPDSKRARASGGDPEYRAALEALVKARQALDLKEAEIYAQRSRAEMERDRALRDSEAYSNWSLAQAELEKVCLEIDDHRTQRLFSAQFRRSEIARLQAATTALQQDLALSADRFRQKHTERSARMVQEAKSSDQLLANIKARIAAATQERDALAKAK